MHNPEDAELTFQALDNALENGYDLDKWSVDETVQDLQHCWYYAEKLSTDDLALFVRAWRKKQGWAE